MQFPTPGTKVADLMRIFHRHESRDLAGAVQFFLNRPHLEQHGALEDAVATVELLAEMVSGLEHTCSRRTQAQCSSCTEAWAL